jgi:hypothetical protein
MEAQQRWVKAQGAALIIVIAPNQHTIYPERMPLYVNRAWPETRLDQIMRRLQERGSSLAVVDPRRDLWAARQHHLLYHKYEDHWNARGAFIAYSAAMKEAETSACASAPHAVRLRGHAGPQSLEYSASGRARSNFHAEVGYANCWPTNARQQVRASIDHRDDNASRPGADSARLW